MPKIRTRTVENGGILSPEAVASGERERSQHQECLDAVFVDEAHCIEKCTLHENGEMASFHPSSYLSFRPHL